MFEYWSTIQRKVQVHHDIQWGEILWVNTLRYIGVHIYAAHNSSRSIRDAKSSQDSFYRSFNCIFGKIGRTTSENVIIQLLNEIFTQSAL